jgi:hypothetical protein
VSDSSDLPKDWTTLKGGGLRVAALHQNLMSSVHDVAWVGAASCFRRYRPRRLSVVEVSRKEAELEKASEAQLSHMDCDKVAQAALKFGEEALRVIALFKHKARSGTESPA